jgi:tetratricopeptide (TPR) repeat protein
MMKNEDQSLKLSLDPHRRLLTRAEIRMVTGRLDQAREDLDRILKEDPCFLEARITRAYLYYVRKEYRSALEDLKAARNLVGGNRVQVLQYFEDLLIRIPCTEASSHAS